LTFAVGKIVFYGMKGSEYVIRTVDKDKMWHLANVAFYEAGRYIGYFLCALQGVNKIDYP